MTKNAPTLPSTSATALPATASSSVERINTHMDQAAKIAVEKRISAVHQQAKLLQGFAAQSKRKLSLGKALEQAAQLSGHKDYQTAKATIEKEEADRLALSKVQVEVMCQTMSSHETDDGMIAKMGGKIKPWQQGQKYKSGQFLIKQFSDSFTVRLEKEGSARTSIEVIFEMDVDLPRLCIYTPEVSDNPVFSIHSGEPGLVLQYMEEGDPLYHKTKADGLGLEMIKKVADTPKCVWFVPRDNANEEI